MKPTPTVPKQSYISSHYSVPFADLLLQNSVRNKLFQTDILQNLSEWRSGLPIGYVKFMTFVVCGLKKM